MSTSAVDSLAAALVDANDQLLALYDLTSVVGRSLDASVTVPEILERLRRLLQADLVTLSCGSHSFRSSFGSAEGVGEETLSLEVGDGNGSAGAVTIVRRDGFGTAEVKLTQAVVRLALASIRTSELHDTQVRQAIMGRELEAAAELAGRALPAWRPRLSGAELFARSDPANAAGGDLYTFAQVGDMLYFAFGDVSGKGLPAAMVMTTIISAANAAFSQVGSSGPSAVLETISAWTHDYLSDVGLFATVVVGDYDESRRRLRMANAGHSPVLWCAGGACHPVPAATPPLGVLPIGSPRSETLDASAGGLLAVGSDGLTEQLNAQDQMFGDDRLVALLSSGDGGSLRDLGNGIFDRVSRFAGRQPQTDDRTLMLLRCEERRA